MNLLLLVYILGSLATLIFLMVAFVIINYKDGTQATRKDFWISVASILGWPIFWVLLLASQFK